MTGPSFCTSDLAGASRVSFTQAAAQGSAERVAALLASGREWGEDTLCQAFLAAATGGHDAVVTLLLPRNPNRRRRSEAFQKAVAFGHRVVVARLLPLVDPHESDGAALQVAARSHHLAVLALLLPGAPLSALGEALQSAALKDQKEVVRMLAPRADEKSRADALWVAAGRASEATVRLLLDAGVAESDCRSAALEAVRHGRAPAVALLVEKLSANTREALLDELLKRTPLWEKPNLSPALDVVASAVDLKRLQALPPRILARLPHTRARALTEQLEETLPASQGNTGGLRL